MANLSTIPSSDRLSVLFVCQSDLRGPSEKQMMGFAQTLARHGHRIMMSLGGDVDSAGVEALVVDAGITLVEHRFAGRKLRDRDRVAARAFAPSLIHSVNSRVPTAAAAADYACATGAPVFVHFEDNEWNAWPGVPGESIYYRLGRHIRRFQSTLNPPVWPHSTPRTRRWVSKRALALDALTPELAAEVAARLRRPCATLLPVSPEAQQLPAAHLELPANLAHLPLAVVTGTIYPFSLQDTIQGLRAVAEVQRRGHELGYVHPGNVHPRIDAPALAREAGLAPGTYAFPGLVPYSSVGPLLERATVLLQPGGPSDFNRLRLPSKLQAYLASGTPTITFAVGFGQQLADRLEVLKIHTGDPEELAARIIEVLQDTALRAELAAGGPRAAERLFDPERNTNALLAHYRHHLCPVRGSSA